MIDASLIDWHEEAFGVYVCVCVSACVRVETQLKPLQVRYFRPPTCSLHRLIGGMATLRGVCLFVCEQAGCAPRAASSADGSARLVMLGMFAGISVAVCR